MSQHVNTNPPLRSFRAFKAAPLFLSIACLFVACGKESHGPVAGESSALARSAEGLKPPFSRSMVLSGANFNSPMHIAFYDAAVDSLGPIDLVVGSCGGGMAAALINLFPDRQNRKDFIESSEFHQFLLQFDYNRISTTTILNHLADLSRDGDYDEEDDYYDFEERRGLEYPNLFSLAMLRVPAKLRSATLDRPFSRKIRTIIMGSRVNYDLEKQAGQPVPEGSRKLYTESYFTDAQTATWLKGLKSYVGEKVPGSFLSEEVEIRSDVSVLDAARASVTDPYLVSPALVNGEYYTAGSVNIDPINVARHLSKEVVTRYGTRFDEMVETPTLRHVYNYNPNQVRRLAYGQKVDYWIDGSAEMDQIDTFAPKIEFDPRGLIPFNGKPLVIFSGSIPKDYAQYRQMVKDQYQNAYDRAEESLSYPRGSMDHIRQPTYGTHEWLR